MLLPFHCCHPFLNHRPPSHRRLPSELPTPPLAPVPLLLRTLRCSTSHSVRADDLMRVCRTLHDLVLVLLPLWSHFWTILFQTHSASATLVSLLLLKVSRHTQAHWPSHWPFPLPGMPFSQIFTSQLLHLCQVFPVYCAFKNYNPLPLQLPTLLGHSFSYSTFNILYNLFICMFNIHRLTFNPACELQEGRNLCFLTNVFQAPRTVHDI